MASTWRVINPARSLIRPAVQYRRYEKWSRAPNQGGGGKMRSQLSLSGRPIRGLKTCTFCLGDLRTTDPANKLLRLAPKNIEPTITSIQPVPFSLVLVFWRPFSSVMSTAEFLQPYFGCFARMWNTHYREKRDGGQRWKSGILFQLTSKAFINSVARSIRDQALPKNAGRPYLTRTRSIVPIAPAALYVEPGKLRQSRMPVAPDPSAFLSDPVRLFSAFSRVLFR
jgi:hypothetical protein